MFKPTLNKIAPYRVANPPHRIKLNQNESSHEIPARLKDRIMARLRRDSWARYPAYPGEELRERLATRLELPPESLILGHGSSELLLSAALAVLGPGRCALVVQPGFALFERMARLVGAPLRRVPLEKDLSLPGDALLREAACADTALVLIASPNNPTGSTLAPEELLAVARATPGLVLLDEAYHEFAATDCRALVDEAPNLIITRTFSKAFALAGLRLGYAMAPSEIISRLELATLPFSVDRFAQIAGEELLASEELIRPLIERTQRERERLLRALGKLPGLRAFPSQANFVLARFEDAGAVWRALLERGILVRDVSAAAGLDGCLRISVGTHAENTELIGALKEILS